MERSLALSFDEPGVDDKLLLLDERTATDEVHDELNRRRVGQSLWLLSAVMLLYSIVGFGQAWWLGLLAATMLVADLALLRLRSRPFLHRNPRLLGTGLLVGHLLLLQALDSGRINDEPVMLWFIVLPLLAARFRFTAGELLALFGSLFAVITARLMIELFIGRMSTQSVTITLASLLILLFLPLFAFAWGMTQRRESRFLVRLRAASGRQRERLRMKQELEYARQIQLSMLPREAPDLDWIEVAALSLPATEVGGDYYDYFPLDADRLAVVVGDVTGHGVASGLVLSGVRSSLNLLQDELSRPRQILAKVNTMLKRTSARRMLMTLGVAVLDRQRQGLKVATAGHPPVLVLRHTRDEVLELGTGAFPLGAMDRSEYREHRVPVGPGDVVLIYSDGLVETANQDQDQFGWERLHQVLLELDGQLSAKEIRDTILREVWSFKGEAEQNDDVTMVVIRLKQSFATPATQAGQPGEQVLNV